MSLYGNKSVSVEVVDNGFVISWQDKENLRETYSEALGRRRKTDGK